MDTAFSTSLYPVNILAYSDSLRRASAAAPAAGTPGVAPAAAVAPVQSATAGQGGLPYRPPQRQSRPARLHRDTPESAYGPHALSFASVLARYRNIDNAFAPGHVPGVFGWKRYCLAIKISCNSMGGCYTE